MGPLRVDGADLLVIQVPKLEPRIIFYELSDFEWAAIKPRLPNKPRGIPRVDDLVDGIKRLVPQLRLQAIEMTHGRPDSSV
jgi:hypothetical protein